MSLAALLLAGGASSRMGEPKALLEFEGIPLWRRQIEKLRELKPERLYISAPRGLEISHAAATTLYDDEPGLGPLAGFARLQRETSADWIVVLAVDLPALTAGYLRGLLERAMQSGAGQVPHLDGRDLALAAVYPAVVLVLAERQLHLEDRSLQAFVRDGVEAGLVERRPVPDRERAFFANLNTPADYRAFIVSPDAPELADPSASSTPNWK